MVQNLQMNIYNQRKDSIQSEVENTISVINYYYQQEVNGILNQSQAQLQAAIVVSHMRYGPENLDYFWIQQTINDTPYIVMHPLILSLNGTNVSNVVDKKGLHVYIALMDLCNGPTKSGFLRYYWQYYSNTKDIEPKLGYVQEFTPWSWIIGTGVYINDLDVIINQQVYSDVLIVAFLFIIIIIASVIFTWTFTKKIKLLIKATHKVKEGDLMVKTNVKSSDEIGELANAFDTMISSIMNKITVLTVNAKNSSAQLTSSAQQLASSSQEVNASSEEIASISQNISKGANEQTALVNNVTEKILTLSNQFDENMNRITNSIVLINSITSQVNMLSLNASIEAARAGEYGRGFAVVADNIRRLADSVKQTNDEINNAISVFKSTSTHSMAEIKELILKVSVLAKETAEGAIEASSATEEEAATMEQITASAQEFTHIAEGLEELLRSFKIE